MSDVVQVILAALAVALILLLIIILPIVLTAGARGKSASAAVQTTTSADSLIAELLNVTDASGNDTIGNDTLVSIQPYPVLPPNAPNQANIQPYSVSPDDLLRTDDDNGEDQNSVCFDLCVVVACLLLLLSLMLLL